jgi:hypothetical protein
MGAKAGRADKVKNSFTKGLSVILALACASAAALCGAKYPPGVRWREIGRDGITVIFPAGRGAEAAEALAMAEALHGKLARFWGFSLRGRTRIVLGDFSDDANGFASFFPYNLVGVDLAEPPPDSEIASSRGWLDLVLAHEMTHLFTLNAGAPPFVLGRRLFGTNPVFFPSAQLPPWAVEGLAIEGESRFSADGRLNRAPYRLMLDAARRDGRFPGWRSLAGVPAAWPGGTGKYLFGAGFMEFLVEKHGSAALRRYVERFSTRILTLGASRDFSKLFGRPLGELWDEYRQGKGLPRRPKAEPITREGFANRHPCSLANGALAYYHRDYRSRGEVRLIDREGRERSLFKKDAVAALAAAPRERLLLSASELYRSFRDWSDLYEYDLKKGNLKRLSRGKRLSFPAVAPDRPGEPERIYCVERRNNRSRLALFDPKRGEARSISMAFAGMAQVAVSPDGARIAAAAKPAGGPWGIAVFLSSGGMESFLTLAGSDLSQPRWQADGTLLFIVTGREDSFLAAWSREAGGAWRLDEPRLAGTRQFDLSADGKEILFARHSGRGEEIARTAAGWIPQSPLEISAASGIPDAKAAAAAIRQPASRPYRFWRDLLPRWWSPALRAGGDEAQAGAATGGQDALGIHSWRLEGYYGLDSRRGNFLFRYAFDGLLPTLSLSLADTVDYDRDSFHTIRTRELTLASLWPLRLRKRSQLRAYADMHLEKRTQVYGGREYDAGEMRNGFRLGLGFNSSREHYDSVSPSDGVGLAAQATIQPAFMGNELASNAVQADLRAYVPLLRPGVLALRLAAAKNWQAGSRYYDMGGFAAESGLGSSHPFRLLRAFAANEFHGDQGWQLNAEYRVPLFRINKGILPSLALDRVWLRPFIDLGRLAYRYRSHHVVLPVMVAVGGEAVLRLAAGGAVTTDLSIGFARGSGVFRQDMIYFGTSSSF